MASLITSFIFTWCNLNRSHSCFARTVFPLAGGPSTSSLIGCLRNKVNEPLCDNFHTFGVEVDGQEAHQKFSRLFVLLHNCGHAFNHSRFRHPADFHAFLHEHSVHSEIHHQLVELRLLQGQKDRYCGSKNIPLNITTSSHSRVCLELGRTHFQTLISSNFSAPNVSNFT